MNPLKYKMIYRVFHREELKEQLEKKKKGSRALADFEDKMNEVRINEGNLKYCDCAAEETEHGFSFAPPFVDRFISLYGEVIAIINLKSKLCQQKVSVSQELFLSKRVFILVQMQRHHQTGKLL